MRRAVVAAALAAQIGCNDGASGKGTAPVRSEIAVRVGWVGAEPAAVENAIVDPLEQALSDLPGVSYLRSVSRADEGEVRVGFSTGSGLDASLAVRQRVNAVVRDLPSDAESPVVQVLDARERRYVVVSAAESPPVELREQAVRVAGALARLPGVRDLSVCGGASEEWRIDLDPGRLTAFTVSPDEVLAALRAARAEVDACPASDTVVVALPDGANVRLADLARVERRAIAAPCTATQAGLPVAVVELGVAESDRPGTDLEVALADFRRDAPADLVIGPLSAALPPEVVLADTRPRWSQGVWPPERPGSSAEHSSVDLRIDRDRAAHLGVSPAAITRTVRLAIAGELLATAIPCRLAITAGGGLSGLGVRAADGRLVPLGEVAAIGDRAAEPPILHADRVRLAR